MRLGRRCGKQDATDTPQERYDAALQLGSGGGRHGYASASIPGCAMRNAEAGATVCPFPCGSGAGRDDLILAAAPGIAQTCAALLALAIPGCIQTDAQA
jgi:hypothetical protein